MEEKEFKLWLDQQRRSLNLFLDREGTWWHDEQPVQHPKVSRAFSLGIGRHEETGEPVIQIGNTWCYFRSAGSPYIVKRLIHNKRTIRGYRLNTEEILLVEDTTPFCIDDMMFLTTDRLGEIHFDRSTQSQLGPFLSDEGGELYLLGDTVKQRIDI